MAQRKLTAIMFTDIVGYTTLMGSDEDKDFAVLRKNRDIHKNHLNNSTGHSSRKWAMSYLIDFTSRCSKINILF